nr:unnamed protein product [Callosobruchus chinensis]
MVEFNASKTQYCTLSNKWCTSEHSVLMSNQALPRSHSFKLLGENMIWHEHLSPIATAAGKKLRYLCRARKYFSPSNLLTLYKAQIRPSRDYCSHSWEAAASTTLSILDAVQRRAIRLIGDLALTCHLQPLSHQRALVTSPSSTARATDQSLWLSSNAEGWQLPKDLAAWRCKNIVEFNTPKTQYCTLSNKRCPSEHSVLMNN